MAYAQSKGSAGERELAEWLFKKGLTQTICKRNLEQTRSGGIDLIPEDHPFAYEVKRVESITTGLFARWWGKACSDAAKRHREPVVGYRTKRSDWMFMISVEKLLGMPGSYAIINSVTFTRFAQKRIIGYGE